MKFIINDELKEIFNSISAKGKLFFYSHTAVFSYLGINTSIFKVVTSLNIADIALFIREPFFDSDIESACYVKLSDGSILVIYTHENECSDDLTYLQTFRELFTQSSLNNFFYNYKKKSYFQFADVREIIKNRRFVFHIEDSISNEELMDIGYFIVMSDFDNQFFYASLENRSLEYISYRFYLDRILTGLYPYNFFDLLRKCSLLLKLFPFMERYIGIEQDKFYHPEGDVFEHTITCFKYVTRPSLKLVFSILLHDYGKSVVKYKNGFPGHAGAGRKQVKRILRLYHFDEDFIDDVAFLVENHMVSSYVYRLNLSDVREHFKNELGRELMKLFKADTLGSVGKLDQYTDIKSYIKRNKAVLK